MIHPSTELRHIDAELGYGVFATSPLPKGTITYVWDPLEVEVFADDPRLQVPALREPIERYSYIDSRGARIVSWDHAKYVNHCCQCNTMSTAYGFEIAVRDIEAGEQITDEYGMFNLREPMKLRCSTGPCRGEVQAADLDRLCLVWDEQIKAALRVVELVEQPLWPLVDLATATAVECYARWGEGYRSVRELGEINDRDRAKSG
jgi:hypothetical protein